MFSIALNSSRMLLVKITLLTNSEMEIHRIYWSFQSGITRKFNCNVQLK